MPAIYANPEYFERDEEGLIDHVLVAVRWVGNSRWYSNNSTHTQGRWPTGQNFLHGSWYVAFVPESVPPGDPGEGIAWFERNEGFEVEYDPARIAEVLLDHGFDGIEAGGPIGDGDTLPGFDEKARNALGIEPVAEAGKTELEQLKELAGMEASPADAPSQEPDEYLVNEYDRTALKEAVKATREDTDEFSLRGKSMADMAAYLVDKHGEDAEREVREAN